MLPEAPPVRPEEAAFTLVLIALLGIAALIFLPRRRPQVVLVLVTLVLVGVGAEVPALIEAAAWLDEHRRPALWLVGTAAGVGWLLLMIGTVGPAVVHRGPSASASLVEVKAAWRARSWRGSPRWRFFFLAFAGAALLAVGLCGLVVVLAPTGIKLLFLGALLYAAVRTVVAFWRA